MHDSNQQERSPAAVNPQESVDQENINPDLEPGKDGELNNSAGWGEDIEKTLQLGEQFVGILGGVVDLARMEALLAVRTLPKLIMFWFLIMPIMLLAWIGFSVLIAWLAYSMSAEVGFGLLAFFLLQILSLLACRWLFSVYKARMTLPYTRAQLSNFMRRFNSEFTGVDKTKES